MNIFYHNNLYIIFLSVYFNLKIFLIFYIFICVNLQLYFLKDFKVPATNNQVELDQRNIKIKQKIGKFRSETGAEIYAIIRSCINTYKKHGINVYRALIKAFGDETVIA